MPLFSKSLCGMLSCWMFSSSIWIYPHSLSYFNESIGGPLSGPDHLLGSNVDWGQDFLHLAKFQKSVAKTSSSTQPLYFASTLNRREYDGLVIFPYSAWANSRPLPSQISWFAASVGFFRGDAIVFAGGRLRDFNETPIVAQLRKTTPTARAGYSIAIYDLRSN